MVRGVRFRRINYTSYRWNLGRNGTRVRQLAGFPIVIPGGAEGASPECSGRSFRSGVPGLRIAAGFADHEVDSGFALMRAPE